MIVTKVVKDKKTTAVTSAKQFQELAGKADELTLYAQNARGQGHFFVQVKPSGNSNNRRETTVPKAARLWRLSPRRARLGSFRSVSNSW